jgi:cation:H+ antiporter
LTFQQFPLWLNLVVFALLAVAVWSAGSRLIAQVETIARRLGMGHAFAGMLLLGTITSLPELVTLGVASWLGNAALGVNNLFGSVAFNLLLLAIADAVIGRQALTAVVSHTATILQGVLGIVALAIAVMAILTGDRLLFGVGLWSSLLLLYSVGAFWLAARYGSRPTWIAVDAPRPATGAAVRSPDGSSRASLLAPIANTTLAAGVILVTGYGLARCGDALAAQTGLGSGLIGFLLVGIATSLPELSSVVAAVRQRYYEMAIGDVFGTNIFNISLLFVADALYGGGPVLGEAGRFEALAALIGIVLTAAFVVGLLERENRTILRMGYDAFASIWIYAGGVALLWFAM